MSAILRSHGLAWGELELVETGLGKSVQLILRRSGKQAVLLEVAVLGDGLVYSAINNKPVLGDQHEIARGKEKP